MPHRWTLHYQTVDEEMKNRVRLHIEALRQDPYVAHVEWVENAINPNIEIVEVTFTRGRTQPSQPSLHHLDLLYRYPATIESAANYADTNVLDSVPNWLRVGAWVRTPADDVRFEVMTLTPAHDSVAVALREWGQEHSFAVMLSVAMVRFQPTGKPEPVRSWQARLMSDDDY